MSDFNITVDTREMADSIDSVKGHVNGVTTAVVAMQTAVIHAQNEASKKICDNVDNGFYVLMRSQLSQKIAAVSSEMFSKQQLMETFKNEIDRVMAIMNDDYARIKRRYLKHFTSLDQALETRIHELDKRAYEISKNYNASQYRCCNEIMKTIEFSDQTQAINVQQVGALVKSKSTRTIGVMSNNVLESVNYTKTLGHILKDSSVEKETEEFIPVLVVETDSMITEDTSVKNIYTPKASSIPETPIVNTIQEESKNFEWSEVNPDVFNNVKNLFLEKCNSGDCNERVAKEMIRLFESSKWSGTSTKAEEE